MDHRRIFSEQEHEDLHRRFVKVWGEWYGGYCNREDIPMHVTLHTDVLEGLDRCELISGALWSRGVQRVLELREWGDGWELELDLANFQYTGAEGFWTADEMDWMVTVSHEASITFGGEWLVAWMRERLPGYERYIYKGWDSKLY